MKMLALIAVLAIASLAVAEPPQITLACGAGGIGPGPDEAPPPKKAVCTCGVNCPCKAKPAPQTTNAVVRPTNPVVVRSVAQPVVIRQSAPVRGNCPNGQCSVPR
jgi:hypothetical protein